MKINYLKTVNFRKFEKEFETEIYDVTSISGKNRSGKTNILYAIVNIILGTNLSGDEKACLINKNCDSSYGELHFVDNQGNKHILIRGKHKYNSKNNFILLDGRNVSQADLVSFYKDKKLFLSVINPSYFFSKKPSEQKELVDKYLPNIDIKNVFNKLEKDEQKVLESVPSNIPNYISELNSDIKRNENLISNLNGKIEYAQNIVSEKLPEYKNFEKDDELALARQELAFITTNKDMIKKESQKQVVENLEKEILNKETEIKELEKSMIAGKKKYLEIKSGANCNCPTCEQPINDISKAKTIENMKNQLMANFDKKNLLVTQKKDLQVKFTIERCKYHGYDGETIAEKNKRISIIEETIRKLENEKLEIEKHNNEITLKEANIKNAENDIKEFKNQILKYQKLISDTEKAKKIAQKLYISYIEEKMKFAKQYLKDVDIQFYSVLKTTGEIKEDFIITYKGTPLNDLSRSETVAASLEFANMFNKIANTNFPIFIDDYESCVDYEFIENYSNDTQLLVSEVIKGNELSITDYYNNDVIKKVA